MISISPENCEWYTPSKIKKAVYNTLLKIDLDPCSNPGYPNIEATHHYTKIDNGLTKIWWGNVYMNPPYGSHTKKWVRKMIDSYQSGNVLQALILLPARIETNYWYDLSPCVSMWCAIHNRIKFSSDSSSKIKNVGSFGSAMMLLSDDISTQERFIDNFGKIGIIYAEVKKLANPQMRLVSEVTSE